MARRGWRRSFNLKPEEISMSEQAQQALTYTPFFFDGDEVRTVTADGEVRFVGTDVAKRLGYADTVNAMKQHCKGVAKHHPLMTPWR
jgi:prophage antirepressor-like protein